MPAASRKKSVIVIGIPVLIVLSVFTCFLLISGSVERRDPLIMTDLERDGFKGPVRTVTFKVFSPIGETIEKAMYRYDKLGNRMEEIYFDSNDAVVERTVYDHDSDGNLYLTLAYRDSEYPIINATEKTFSNTLFEINVSGLAGEDYYKEGRVETIEDEYGNWVTRRYFARKAWKAFEENLYSENRTLAYYDRSNNNNE